MTRIYNFNPGPATLPEEILKIAQAELLDYKNSGMSILEISHRSELFSEIASQSEKDLRELLNIPSSHKIFFLHGGARSQFAMVPMNLLGDKKTADYVDTGVWSQFAIEEAKKYCDVNVVISSQDSSYKSIPDVDTWKLNRDAAYVHYTANETVDGVEFHFIPETSVPLVSDMSSTILSRPLDVSKFGLIYACAQKNLGPAELTIVIVREDLIGHALPYTPAMFDYKNHFEHNSLYNTSPIFSWYMFGLMLQWVKKQGGVEEIAKRNQAKANKLYQFIDESDFYANDVEIKYRSWMNVPFVLKQPELTERFVAEAESEGLFGLKGHPRLGGARASIYNAMSEKGVAALINFMQKFKGSR
jgi:phosphoserine aminotransferase